LAEAYARSLEEESLIQEIEERQACPECRHRIQPDFILCPNCGEQLKYSCPECHRLMELNWHRCPYCGNEKAVQAPAPAPVLTPASARRRSPEPATAEITPRPVSD
jgi:RNA polymerase subunit RPABC4/transcription elongation factor Spt4